MEPRISIITLGVTDLPRSVEFYRDGLGLPLVDENTESIAFFKCRGTWLALYPREALAADARGYVIKYVISDTIVDAVLTVLRGDVFVLDGIARVLQVALWLDRLDDALHMHRRFPFIVRTKQQRAADFPVRNGLAVVEVLACQGGIRQSIPHGLRIRL